MSQQSGSPSNQPEGDAEHIAPDARAPGGDGDDAPGAGYGPPPQVRSAYPGPEEGGFYIAPMLPPDEHTPPGPGYGPTGPTGAAAHQAGSTTRRKRGEQQDSLADIWSAASAATPSAATPSGGPGAPAGATSEGSTFGGTHIRGEWSRIGIGAVLALLLGAITMIGLALVPAVATVAALVLIAAGLVLSWPTATPMRHTVLLALAGPAGVLLGYWLIQLLSG